MNALLEQWERESEKVYGHNYANSGLWEWNSEPHPATELVDTHIAILWNPKEIGERE